MVGGSVENSNQQKFLFDHSWNLGGFLLQTASKSFKSNSRDLLSQPKKSAGLANVELVDRLSPPSYLYWWRIFLNVFACLASTFGMRIGSGWNKCALTADSLYYLSDALYENYDLFLILIFWLSLQFMSIWFSNNFFLIITLRYF